MLQVTVIDKDYTLTNRLCQSYNDPHITTFDGKLQHYMEVGEFVNANTCIIDVHW